jgi:hypothetical protein
MHHVVLTGTSQSLINQRIRKGGGDGAVVKKKYGRVVRGNIDSHAAVTAEQVSLSGREERERINSEAVREGSLPRFVVGPGSDQGRR